MLEASQCFHLYFQELPFTNNITFKYYSKGSVLQTLDQSNWFSLHKYVFCSRYFDYDLPRDTKLSLITSGLVFTLIFNKLCKVYFPNFVNEGISSFKFYSFGGNTEGNGFQTRITCVWNHRLKIYFSDLEFKRKEIIKM